MKTCSTDSHHLRKCIISWRLISEPLQNSINLVLAQNEYISSFEKSAFCTTIILTIKILFDEKLITYYQKVFAGLVCLELR